MFRYCPACASPNISFENGKTFRCPDCGFTYYHNVCAATSCLLRAAGGSIVAVVRAKNPEKGKLHLPGGFVNPGEGLIEGARRECVEEIGVDPGEGLRLFASFPNVYPYKSVDYNTCDCFLIADLPGLTEADLTLERKEVAGVRFLDPAEVRLDEFAFPSVRRALSVFLGRGDPLGPRKAVIC